MIPKILVSTNMLSYVLVIVMKLRENIVKLEACVVASNAFTDI